MNILDITDRLKKQDREWFREQQIAESEKCDKINAIIFELGLTKENVDEICEFIKEWPKLDTADRARLKEIVQQMVKKESVQE